MIYLTKKPKESNEKLIGRFQKKVQGSRIIPAKKAQMHFKTLLTKRIVRKRALMRDQYRAEREKKKYL